MKPIRTTLAATALALSALSAAPVPANAQEKTWEQNFMDTQNYWRQQNFWNNYRNRQRANRRRSAPRRAPHVRMKTKKTTPSHSAHAVNSKGRDCAPINGPYGYYANPWCDGFNP